ncbi:hypothetical protein BDP27DRAFT_455113 [Rhodocollybia butyracea]|uniref:Uncharacterized protein n=1 Tax=Rhodocollybia butyracea TaxID=206335 RepID=A0A9P5P7F5_9AGAR|nr:hypothetical protein BDP27DRAFT_455113 [Rhodocollybia butyracea]
MHYTLLLFFVVSWFAAVAGALSIHIPYKVIVPGKPLNISWQHEKHENTEFFLRKIKLDEPGGPGAPSTEVIVQNSKKSSGMSPLIFDKPGLFAVVAFDAENKEPSLQRRSQLYPVLRQARLSLYVSFNKHVSVSKSVCNRA